jgi:hypothetical protein
LHPPRADHLAVALGALVGWLVKIPARRRQRREASRRLRDGTMQSEQL